MYFATLRFPTNFTILGEIEFPAAAMQASPTHQWMWMQKKDAGAEAEGRLPAASWRSAWRGERPPPTARIFLCPTSTPMVDAVAVINSEPRG